MKECSNVKNKKPNIFIASAAAICLLGSLTAYAALTSSPSIKGNGLHKVTDFNMAPTASVPMKPQAGDKVYRSLKGFVGLNYLDEVDDSDVKVIESSLNVSSLNSKWSAKGLVRNETRVTYSGVDVTAVLHGKDGSIIKEVSAPTLIHTVRHGKQRAKKPEG
jgi:hypothetical protein